MRVAAMDLASPLLGPETDVDIPLAVIGLRSLAILSSRLDVTQILVGPHGYRDWRGLAALAGFDRDSVELMGQRGESPTEALIDAWVAQSRKERVTLHLLIQNLVLLERFDVIDDVMPHLDHDVKLFRNKHSGDLPDSISDPLLKLPEGCPVYDAYVCYTAEDFPFVQTLVEKLERPELGIRLFLPERDLCAGVLKYNTFFQLMEKWCKKTIIIFSPEFLKSHECRMQQKFIESIEIEQAQQKLIPVVIKPCALDGMIRMISKINLCETASALSHWSWNNLISSIKSSGNGSFVQRAPSLCALRLAPSPPEVRAPSATRARTPVAAPKAVEVASHSHKGKAKWLSGIFSRKKNNSVSSASSGFQSMATPE